VVLKARVEKMRRCKRICIFLLLYAYCIFYSLRSGASADENPRKGEKRRKVSYGIPTTVSSAWHRSSKEILFFKVLCFYYFSKF